MSNIDTTRFLNRLLRLIDDLEFRGPDGLQRVRDFLRDHDPSARDCVRSLASSGRSGTDYVGIVNEVHDRLAGAEARGLDSRVVADAVLLLVESGANPFVALRTRGPDHALLSARPSSRLICDHLARNAVGYVSATHYLDADDVSIPGMLGLRTVALGVGRSAPVAPQALVGQVLPDIMNIVGMQGSGIDALLQWRHFATWLRLSAGPLSESAATLAALDEQLLQYLIPAAMRGDGKIESVRRGLAVEEAVRALVEAARGQATTLRKERIGFTSAVELFEPFRQFAFAIPAEGGALPHGLIDDHTLAAIERTLGAASDLRLPAVDPVGPSLRETQRRVRLLARLACAGTIDEMRIPDLLFPIGADDDDREAYRCGFERVHEGRIRTLLGRAGSQAKVVRLLGLMAQIEVDTFSPALDAGAPAQFLKCLVACAEGEDDDTSEQVFSGEFFARARGYLLSAHGDSDPAVKARRDYLNEIGGAEDVEMTRLSRAIGDDDVHEMRSILRSNFHREFDLDRIVAEVVPQLGGSRAGDGCRRDFEAWVTSGAFDAAAAGGEVATFGPLLSMTADELIHEATDRPLERHGIYRVPIAHAVCYLAGAGRLAAREALVSLATVGQVSPALLRQLWAVDGDNLGRTSGYALASACSRPALEALTGPNVEQAVRNALRFGRATSDGVTALMAAARSAPNDCDQRIEGFRALLAARDVLGLGPVEARDARGWRAIHHAVACGNTEAAQMLMAGGASVGIEPGDGTSVLVEAFDCADKSRYAFGVWFVSGSALPAIKQRDGGKVPADLFSFGRDRLDHRDMPRTVANVGITNDHYLRFVQFASDHAEVWEGLTPEAVNWMFSADSGIDRFRMVADLSPQLAAGAVDDQAIFRLMKSLRPRHETGSIAGTVDIVDALRRIKALKVDGKDSQRRSVFHVLAGRLQALPKRLAVTPSDQCSLVRALLGANPAAHERAVSHTDLDGRSSVVVATSGGQVLLAMLLSRALAARDSVTRNSKIQGAARMIHNPGQLARLVSGEGMGMLQMSPTGEVLLNCGERTIDLGASAQGPLRVDAPREVRNVVDWLNRQDVQAAIETNLAVAFNQPNFAVTFDDFVAWLDHLAKSR